MSSTPFPPVLRRISASDNAAIAHVIR
ncbi:GNAT family N-acetyltransferase, partial [Salmonella enterica]|nr:GNAT family N-acetyltransferase [Salmonella enterica]